MQIDIENASRDELIRAYQFESFQNKEANQRIELLEHQVEWLKKQVFGQKSEKLIPQDPKQRSLFEVEENPPEETTTVKAYERKNRKEPSDTDKNSHIRFDDKVPVEEVVVLPREVEDLDESKYEVIGEKVTERLHQIPSTFKVVRTIRKTVKLSDRLLTAPAPCSVIHRSFADKTFLASLITEKFQYHLPLYRQHQRMREAGVYVDRGHLTTLVHRSLELLEPLYLAILSDITTSEVISMDETPIKAGRKGKGKMNTAYFWPVFSGDQVAFVYSSSRAHGTVSKILGSGCKKLLSDGYSAYERYAEGRPDLVHAECYAHVRRKFFEAKDHSPPECEYVLSLIQKLFEIEKNVKNKPPEDTLSERRLSSAYIVDKLFTYLEKLWDTEMVLKDSPLGKAVRYARDREKQLRVFLEHPDISLSNNHVERAIRPVALGRKNWMFCWSEIGACYAAMAYTLVECCKLQGISPWEYLVDVLERIDSHPAKDIDLLTPRLWKEHFDGSGKNAS